MTRTQFRPIRKNSYIIIAGMQLPIGWGKRKSEDDRRYLSKEVVEKLHTEILTGDDDNDNNDDDDDDDDDNKTRQNTAEQSATKQSATKQRAVNISSQVATEVLSSGTLSNLSPTSHMSSTSTSA